MTANTARPAPRRARLRWGVGRLFVLVVFTALMTSVGLYQVHEHYHLVQVGYALDQDLFEYRRLYETKKRLELSLSAYKDPATVRAFAEDELGMRAPSAQDELYIPRPDEGPPKPELLSVFGPEEVP